MKITDKEKLEINRIFKECGTYAETARRVGCGAGTVKKYIIPNFQEIDEENIIRFTEADLPTSFSIEPFKDLENICDVCELGEEQWEEIRELQKEILI